MEYDSEDVTYDELLRTFWDRHDPTRQSSMKQYENLILYETDWQNEQIQESVRQHLNSSTESLATRIDSLDTFYPAENYHQNYYLRSSGSLKSLVEDSSHDLISSVLATKLNAYAGNHLDRKRLVEQLRCRDVEEDCLRRLNSMVRT